MLIMKRISAQAAFRLTVVGTFCNYSRAMASRKLLSMQQSWRTLFHTSICFETFTELNLGKARPA